MFLQSYKRAVEVLTKMPVMLWGLSLLLSVLSLVAGLVTVSVPFLSIAVSYLFSCGAAKLYMDGLKGKKVNSKQLFAAFNKNCVRTAGAMAWRDLWAVIWGLVPVAGIVKSYSYRFVPYIIMTNPEIDAFDALKISMKMTNGKKLQMWLADLVYVVALFAIGFVLGLLAAIPYIGVLFGLVSLLVNLVVSLFGGIFVGLYQASFFCEEEVAQHVAALEAAEVAPVEAEPVVVTE